MFDQMIKFLIFLLYNKNQTQLILHQFNLNLITFILRISYPNISKNIIIHFQLFMTSKWISNT